MMDNNQPSLFKYCTCWNTHLIPTKCNDFGIVGLALTSNINDVLEYY